MKPDYYCKECGSTVLVSTNGVVTRTCSHVDAPIIAERTSKLYGDGGVTPSLEGRAASAISRIIAAFRGK